MKEIKPVAAKKKPAFIKRRSAVKSKITPSKPGKAKPSKKIASSVKVKPTKAKVLVKPVKTNDPPMHAIKTKIASGAPTVIEVPPDTTMISQPAPVAKEPRPVEPPPARARANFVLPPMPEMAKPQISLDAPPRPVSQLADPVVVQPPREPIHAPQPPMLFECAWEVCWQLGGIYTVLRSKAPAMQQRWGDNYCLIGPYNPATAAMEFEERATEGTIREVQDRLRNQGIACHYGRWLIPGRPRVILLDYRGRFNRLGEDKYLMWADHPGSAFRRMMARSTKLSRSDSPSPSSSASCRAG